MDSKKWYSSKTMWVNGLALIASLLAIFGIGFGPEMQASVVAAVLTVVNLILRFTTKTAVTA